MATPAAQPSRRERNMRDKRERIFRAAEELFAERGFEGTSTQEIAERADVGAGTLFRYASSKAELLLMVANAQLGALIDEVDERATALDDPVEAILAFTLPALGRARERPEMTTAYQRELLFGAANERYRREGLALYARQEAEFAAILRRHAADRGLAADSDAADLAASAVVGASVLLAARSSTGAHPGRDASEDLRVQVTQIVAGFFAGLSPAGTDPPPDPRTAGADDAATTRRGERPEPGTPAGTEDTEGTKR